MDPSSSFSFESALQIFSNHCNTRKNRFLLRLEMFFSKTVDAICKPLLQVSHFIITNRLEWSILNSALPIFWKWCFQPATKKDKVEFEAFRSTSSEIIATLCCAIITQPFKTRNCALINAVIWKRLSERKFLPSLRQPPDCADTHRIVVCTLFCDPLSLTIASSSVRNSFALTINLSWESFCLPPSQRFDIWQTQTWNVLKLSNDSQRNLLGVSLVLLELIGNDKRSKLSLSVACRLVKDASWSIGRHYFGGLIRLF